MAGSIAGRGAGDNDRPYSGGGACGWGSRTANVGRVIKSAPKLPLDGEFPCLHPERQFMHLGYQIYDLAFQSQDGDAVQPLAFATALLLIVIVVGLNLAAIGLHHRLREKYRALTL